MRITRTFRASALGAIILAGAGASPGLTQDTSRQSPGLTACLDGAVTNVAMQDCAAAEYRRQDHRLNQEYRRARARLTTAQFANLRQEQRSWLRQRDSQCRGAGSNASLSITLCQARETAQRATYLARYRAPAGSQPAGSLRPWLGRWQGPEGLFLEVQEGRSANIVRLVVKDSLDDQGSYSGVFTGSTIVFERRGRTETIRRGSGEQTGFSFLRSRRDCLIVVRNSEGYCRPN